MIVWSVTIWVLWSCWLVCQLARAPVIWTRAAIVLLAAELVALAGHWYGCEQGGCGPAANAARSVATFDVPALALLLTALAALTAWRRSYAAATRAIR